MMVDPTYLVACRRQELLSEAEGERLVALTRRPRTPVRRELALACHRLANWLDDPNRYFQRSDSGRVDWAH